MKPEEKPNKCLYCGKECEHEFCCEKCSNHWGSLLKKVFLGNYEKN